ncbi:MAG: hypothetical protein ACOZNI_08945 [Myxococcota bacterium]
MTFLLAIWGCEEAPACPTGVVFDDASAAIVVTPTILATNPPDEGDPVSVTVSRRDPMLEATRWIGFGDRTRVEVPAGTWSIDVRFDPEGCDVCLAEEEVVVEEGDEADAHPELRCDDFCPRE